MGMTRQPAAGEAAAMQADAQRASFGQYLQTIRMQNQIRLEEVAEQTRIRLATLQAIENEDFARLPPEVFTIGFLKAFAQAVGADGIEAVQRYHAHCRLRRQTLRDEAPPTSGRAVSGKLIVALAMLAVLIAACLLAYRYWQQGSTTSPPVRASQPAGEAEAPPAERLAAQPPSQALKPPLPPAAPRHRLLIVAHENSWVKVVIDQGAASEHKLKAGEQLRLEAQTGFNLLIGNVGGVKLSLDNQAVTIPGKRGEVVNIHLP
jgi:transcriptional regulator with XRE-family HTH domain